MGRMIHIDYYNQYQLGFKQGIIMQCFILSNIPRTVRGGGKKKKKYMHRNMLCFFFVFTSFSFAVFELFFF